MDDFTAALLILLVVSPALLVLLVLIARGVREVWKTCAPSAEATERKNPFEVKLCGARS